MERIINYYYGINVIKIDKNKNEYSFVFDGSKYYFIRYDRGKNEINSLITIYSELKNRNIITNEIIRNRFNHYLTLYDGVFYVMIKETVVDYAISINDILYMQNNTFDISLNKSLLRGDWVSLWKTKTDYYEKQISQLNKNYILIKNTMDYYIGLSENAISYIIYNNIKTNHMVVSHRRIDEKGGSFEFYNPLNYIMDNRARDIADYIKILFFYKKTKKETLLSILNYVNFDEEDYAFFLARMLYPTYYFDLVDKIIFQEEKEDVLKIIIYRNDEYIDLIKSMIYYINYNLRINIPIIDWIIKT